MPTSSDLNNSNNNNNNHHHLHDPATEANSHSELVTHTQSTITPSGTINMASPPDSRVMSRRDSSPRSSGKRRPRLLRASATEPSITTSNACRNSLASSQSSRRATDLLSRVAFISGSPPDSVIRSASPISTRNSMFDNMDRQSELSSSPVSHPDGFDELHHHSYSGRYFSFPSFDMYEADQQEENKEDPKSP